MRPYTDRLSRKDVIRLVTLCAAMLLLVAAWPGVLLLGLLIWYGSSASSGRGIELMALPPFGWDILLYILGWLFVIGLVSFAIGTAAFFAGRALKIVASQPPLALGLLQLMRAYSETIKEFAEQY